MSFTSYQLKYIALFTMIIDHTAVVFASFLSPGGYLIMRGIGRLSFPIFCFLLAEGFFRTHDRNRYLLRLLIFAAISEVPFHLAVSKDLRNVFFTLALGFIAMMFLEHFGRQQIYLITAIFVFPLMGELIQCDYSALGVVTILLFYLQRKNAVIPLWLCCVPLMITAFQSPIQFACILSVFLLYCYNGERGHGSKYLFYVAYPAHLLLLYLIQLFVII